MQRLFIVFRTEHCPSRDFLLAGVHAGFCALSVILIVSNVRKSVWHTFVKIHARELTRARELTTRETYIPCVFIVKRFIGGNYQPRSFFQLRMYGATREIATRAFLGKCRSVKGTCQLLGWLRVCVNTCSAIRSERYIPEFSYLLSSGFNCQADELPAEQIAVLRKAFDSFDRDKSGSIPTDMVADILRLMGQPFNKKILDELIDEVDADKSGRLEFDEFVTLAAKFIVEEDAEALEKELREAFRLYDKEGNGYIPTTCLREILRELDDQLTNEELDMMIEEIDSDGSGTVDFDEFMEMMTGE